jgi:hypothetical protein
MPHLTDGMGYMHHTVYRKEINTLTTRDYLKRRNNRPKPKCKLYMMMQLSPFPSFVELEFSFMASISTLRSSALDPRAFDANRLVALLSPPSAACLYHFMASCMFASIPTPVYGLVKSLTW